MKSVGRLDEWCLKYLEHGMDGGKQNYLSTNTDCYERQRFRHRATTESVRNPLFGPD